MFKNKFSTLIRFLTLIVSSCILLMQACSHVPVVPDDILLYCASSFNVIIKGPGGKWQEIYSLEQAGPQIITALAYDTTHKAIAISVESKIPSKGNARLLLIDPATHKVLKEISTGMDRINKMSFDRTGQRIAIIAGQIQLDDPRKLYVLNLTKESFQFLGQGEFLDVSWGLHEDLYLSYKEDKKWFVGSVTVGTSKSDIKQIAEGISISGSDINDSFVYIDMTGKALLVEKDAEVKKMLPTPAMLQDMQFLSAIKFVQGSDGIVISKFGVKWDNLYFLRPPYSKAQKILTDWPFQGFAVAANGR